MNVGAHPLLETKRLKLKPYVAGFATQQHVDWLNDPDVVLFSEQRHHHHTLETQHAYLNAFLDNEYIWLISEKETGKDIGTITAYVDVPNGVANMGIMIGEKACWGFGFATEAWQRVTDWLFWEREPRIRKIECGTMHENYPMRGLATKCGMICEGVLPQHFMLDGEPSGLAFYGRFRPERVRRKADDASSDSKSAPAGVGTGNPGDG